MSMKFFCRSLCVMILFCSAAAFDAVAQLPRTLAYQGVLKNADGSPVAGPVTLTVSLYTVSTGGTAIWGPETHQNVPLSAGVYAITLGKPATGAPVPLTLAFDTPYYLQVTVGNVDMGRHELTSVPYALNAASLDGVTVKDGNIGVGTTSPVAALTLPEGSRLSLDESADDRAIFVPAGEGEPLVLSNAGGVTNPTIRFRNDTIGRDVMIVNVSTTKVGIGRNPSYTLDVNGRIRGSNVAASDARWKTDIAPLGDALAKVTQLRGVTYRWKDAALGEGTQIGIIAQEVEPVFPELVSTDDEGYKSVAYEQMVAPLIEAVKTLKAENDALRTEHAEILRRLTALEAQIANQ